MCVYCMIADWQFKHNPPWPQRDPITPWPPQVPSPVSPAPVVPWDLQKLFEFQDLLRRVKELEDKLGCPCEPNKADYLALLKARIDVLEKKAAEK